MKDDGGVCNLLEVPFIGIGIPERRLLKCRCTQRRGTIGALRKVEERTDDLAIVCNDDIGKGYIVVG